MFTLLVIIFDVVILVWAGIRILRKSKEINYTSGKFLAWSLFLVAYGIFTYGIRSIVIQFGALRADEIIYRLGTPVHCIGFLLALWFVYKEFTPKLFAWISAVPVFGSMFLGVVGLAFFPFIRVYKPAPLEPFKFMMTNYPWKWLWMNPEFLFACFLGSMVVLGIFLYNGLKEENKKKAIFYGIVNPILFYSGLLGVFKILNPKVIPFPIAGSAWIWVGFTFLGAILVILAVITAKEKRKQIKAILYGFGIPALMFPAILCVFVSPIFARIGFGIGAILIYRAFGMKI